MEYYGKNDRNLNRDLDVLNSIYRLINENLNILIIVKNYNC